MDPENSSRYDPYLSLLRGADAAAVAGFYRRYYPLFQESYGLLGYRDAYFNDRLVQVIDHLLATPEAASEPVLIKPEAVWMFQDETLESLSAGQKILLRIGPDHAAEVREFLREIRPLITSTRD